MVLILLDLIISQNIRLINYVIVYLNMRYSIVICFIAFLLANVSVAQQNEAWFEPNRGQWDHRILYKVALQGGDFIIEKDKFTFALSDLKEVYHAAHKGEEIETIKHHTVQSYFVNSSWDGEIVEKDSSTFYKNYILGNDNQAWKSMVRSYKKLEFINYYPSIDLLMEINTEHIKYSFRVYPGADLSQLKILHKGMERLKVSKDEVEIHTQFGAIVENGLKVWTELENGNKKSVLSTYKNEGDTVFYSFPEGYDENAVLIIDPNLTFSTFTGSTSDNWGFTAAPDNDGNLYGGGIVFGTGYPISVGAYDNSFNGGDGSYRIDMGVSKFSPDGTQLIYSTYIGGSGNETPNSIITNAQGELFILGITSSPNFPVTPNAFQSTNKGGTTTTQIAIQFNGTDMTVSRLNANGTSLLASTYLGGAKNDGLNISSLNYNYGDVFRGEIVLDKNGDVVITSSTQSNDFPVVNGSNITLGGSQDAVVSKLSPDLSTLIWSTYLGGEKDDSGYSIQVSPSNNLFITGGTRSSNLPFSGGHQSSFQGGSCDGYVVELDGETSSIVNGTYIGTASYDQSFFVQLDGAGRVYVFGQSNGNFPVTPGVYSNPNSGQFIQQYSSDLSTLNWSTIVGGGNGVVEISPTAFLVSNCNEIYFTGWGGQVNHSVQATGSTSFGFPTTSDAYQSNTNGNNFYVGVLSENALDLKYGTFMGGTNSSFNHVDGGTSRFDKHGSIYHAVCGACSGNANGFTTTPGAYSETNNSTNCNMAVWKFDLGALNASFSSISTTICMPDSVYFENNSQNGSAYFWDFGDGHTSTDFEPTHFYSQTGSYDVMLIVSDVLGCFEADTSFLTIDVLDFDGGYIEPPTFACPGVPYPLESSGGISYQWSPSEFLDDSSSANPFATIQTDTEFTVVVSSECGSDTVSVFLEVAEISTDIVEDLEICRGDTIQIWASGGVQYEWETENMSAFVFGNSSDAVLVAPEQNTSFTVKIITEDGCEVEETMNIKVFQDVPIPVLADSAFICVGESVIVHASGADDIVWSPSNFISPSIGNVVEISTPINQWYYADFTNLCGTVRDSIFVEVVQLQVLAGSDTTVCSGEPVNLWAEGGEVYTWSPAETIASPNASQTTALPIHSTTYQVEVIDKYGCTDVAIVVVNVYPNPYVYTSPDYFGFVGDEVQLNATGSSSGGSYTWYPEDYLSCSNCSNPIASAPKTTAYQVVFIDENGCKATDDVLVSFESLVYVPNTFTPDGDEFNNVFVVQGGNITKFKILIFNRWGELLFESHDIHVGWDGTYGGRMCQDGTYIWKVRYEDLEGEPHVLVGHVNLIR